MVSTLVAPGPALNTPSVLAPELEGLATCPSCHTQDPSTTNRAVSAGADWRCVRCGSRWDAVRLATVDAYEVWRATRACSTVDPAPHAVKAGDTILFGKYAGRDVRVDGVEYLIVKEDDGLAVQARSL